jgi:hypothetical protein
MMYDLIQEINDILELHTPAFLPQMRKNFSKGRFTKKGRAVQKRNAQGLSWRGGYSSKGNASAKAADKHLVARSRLARMKWKARAKNKGQANKVKPSWREKGWKSKIKQRQFKTRGKQRVQAFMQHGAH